MKLKTLSVTFAILMVSLIPLSESGMGMMPCYQCNMPWSTGMQNRWPMPNYYPSFMPYQMPWYNPYGSMAYSNFYYPSPWTMGGVMPRMYWPHGGGNMYMAKPNLYVTGQEGKTVDVRLKFNDQRTTWLASSPAHGDQGWKVTLGKDHKMKVGKADYDFIFSDFRADETKFQDGSGFCVTKDKLIPEMTKTLKVMGFAKNEIKDFEEHWGSKIPDSRRHCVFPQTNTELDAVAEIVSEPKPTKVTRVLFVVMTHSGMVNKKSGKFREVPKTAWKWTGTPERMPASGDALTFREWGVAFVEANVK